MAMGAMTVANKVHDLTGAAATVDSAPIKTQSADSIQAMVSGATASGAFRAILLVGPTDQIADATEVDSNNLNGAAVGCNLRYEGMSMFAFVRMERVDAAATFTGKAFILVQ